MGKYAVFFDYDNKTYRLPVNPEEIRETSVMAIDKIEVLRLGQIAIPTGLQLREWTIDDLEFPAYQQYYVETKNEFYSAGFYVKLFRKWRKKLNPVRFIYGADNDENEVIDPESGESVLVLMEELSISEKAGEEGDKYISFKLLEYIPFGKKEAEKVVTTTTVAGVKSSKKYKASTAKVVNPKSAGYHVVRSGDSLWTIAKTYYGDGSKCNIIYWANTDKIKNPADIQIGWKLRIPSSDEFSKYSKALPKKVTKEPSITGFGGTTMRESER